MTMKSTGRSRACSSAALRQPPSPRRVPRRLSSRQQPAGLAESRTTATLAKCKNPPQPFSIPARGAVGERDRGAAGAGAARHARFPACSRRGRRWKVVWSWEGNNADGPIAGDNGTVLFANNDASNVMQLDPATGLAKIVHRDTNTGGAVSRSKNGALFVAVAGSTAASSSSSRSARCWRTRSTASRSNASAA